MITLAIETTKRTPRDADCNRDGHVMALGRCGENDWRIAYIEHVVKCPDFYTKWLPLSPAPLPKASPSPPNPPSS